MAKKYLDQDGLAYLVTQIKTLLSGKAASSHTHGAGDINSGTLASDRLPTVPITKGGTGATTAAAALTNLGLTATAAELNYMDGVTSAVQTQLNGKAASGHSHSAATTSAAGMMSAADKTKLDGIATGANNYTHPSYTAKSSGLYKMTVDATGHVSAATAVTKSDITGLGIPGSDTTYSAATTSAAGLMSAADKTKLDGIATGATKTTVDTALSSSSTNPVQNKVINAALADKAASSHTHPEQVAMHGITTAGDGAAYTATVDGITALVAGASFIMIPHVANTTGVPTLNVNGLGAKSIRRRVSNSTVTTVAASASGWLGANKPVRMTYDGSYWIPDLERPNAADMYGTLPIANGGTGATTAAAALTNLGAAPAYTYGTDDLTAGESALTTGQLYFVYE